jgi:hypothetical protein
LIKRLSFDQSLRKSIKKTRKNPINTLRNQRKKKEKKRRKTMSNYPLERPYCEGSKA